MHFKYLQHAISRINAKILGRAPAEQQYGPREMEQLAETIVDYVRMRQEHYGAHAVQVGAGDLAMRLRETTHVIIQALRMLKEQGRAEETRVRGRWRLRLIGRAESGPRI